MKSIICGCVALSLALVPEAGLAQTSEADLTPSLLQTGKKVIVAQNMGLTEEEAEAFWPLYNEYQEEIQRINDRLAKLIEDFTREYAELSDERAIEMLNERLTNVEDRMKARRSYFKRFQKILPGKKLARYYQVENTIQAYVEFDLARNVPLVD